MKYDVCKKQRGGDGQWFAYPSRRFATEQEAVEYAERFAADQSGVSGTRIVVTQRKGRRTIKDIRVV